jgi:glycosyltransferase involved in cell wall biosynthesis
MQELFCFNKKKSLIVICLSIYNGSQFLNNQLVSLKNQTYNHNNILLLIRDDGSHDESYEVSKQFAAESSMHIELLDDRTNLGVKKSFELLMNKALEMDASYIMFCDQDDVWHPEKISKTIAMMEQMEVLYPQQPILIHSDLIVVDNDLITLHNSFWKYQNINPVKDTLNRLVLHNTVTGCTTMINRPLAQLAQTIPDEALMHDWWIALVASAFGQIGYVDESLMLYRQHGGNDTGAKQYGWQYWLNRLIKKPSLDKYILQARAFLEHYGDQLTPEHIEILEAVSRLNQMNWLGRRRTLIKYKIFKNGFVRNIGLMVFA